MLLIKTDRSLLILRRNLKIRQAVFYHAVFWKYDHFELSKGK